MATIRATCNKHGNWVVYLGATKYPQGESKYDAACTMNDFVHVGHVVSEKSEITADDLKRFVNSGFAWNAI